MNPASPVSMSCSLIDELLKLVTLATGATDAALWLPDPAGGHLVMTACPGQPVLAGEVRQDLASGLVSAAYQTASLVEDTGMYADKRRSDAVDASHGQRTIAQIAAPVMIPSGCAGVISVALILRDGKAPVHWAFKPDSVRLVQLGASCLSRILIRDSTAG